MKPLSAGDIVRNGPGCFERLMHLVGRNVGKLCLKHQIKRNDHGQDKFDRFWGVAL